MARTVKVRLELDRNDYKAGLRDAANDMRGFDGEVRSAGKDAHAMGVEVKSAGTQVEAMGREVDAAAKKTASLGDEADKAKRKTTDLGGETRKTKEETAGLGGETDKTKEKTKSYREETDKTKTKIVELAKEITTTKAALASLGDEFQKTGKVNVDELKKLSNGLRDLERAKADVEKLTRSDDGNKGAGLFGAAVKAAGPSGMQAGTVFGGGFLSAAGSVLAAGSPVLVPILVALVGGAAVAAGLGTVGAAAIVGGIVAQFGDPRVKGAAVDLGTYLKGQLVEATSGFVGPFTSGVAALKREISPLWGDLQKGFRALEPYVANLLMKIGQGMAMLGPGLGRAMEAAGPIIGAIAKNIPTLMNAVNIFFDEISKGGKGAAEAIDGILKAVSLLVAGLGFALRAASNMFDFFAQAQDKIAGGLAKMAEKLAPFSGAAAAAAGPLRDLANYSHGIATSFDESTLAAGGASGSLDLFTGSAGGAAGAASTLYANLGPANQSLQTFQGTMMSADQAAGAWRQGLLGVADSVKQHGTTLEKNTADGEANISMLQGMVEKAKATREANVINGQSIAYADEQYQKNIQTLIDNATKLGMNREQVEALIGKYKEVPGDVKTQVELLGAIDAINKGSSLADILKNLDGKVSRASVITTYMTTRQDTLNPSVSQGLSRGTSLIPNRYGGIVHAAEGLITRPGIYAGRGEGSVVMAEQPVGHEAFIPQLGISQSRAMSLASEVGDWHGFDVVPRQAPGYAQFANTRPMSGGGGGNTTYINVNVNAGMVSDREALARDLAGVFRPYISSVGGGNVQVALGRS